MNNPVVRSIAALLAGVVVAVLVIGITEFAGHAMFPPPADLDVSTPAGREQLWNAIPVQSKIMVVLAWFLGSFAGACTAIAIALRVLPAWTVGLVIAAMGLWTTQILPHPAWMVVSAMVLPLIAVLVAKRLMADRIAPPA